MKRQLINSNLWIEQTRGHSFNLDTVLLAHFVKLNYKIKSVLDIGTGNGSLALYLSEKTKAKITGIEIQESRYQQALTNVKLNKLESQIDIILEDYLNTNFKDIDVIVCNPPFFKVDKSSNLNQDDSITMARHEISLDLESLIIKVSEQLKYSGKFFMIHRPDRLIEIIRLCDQNHLTIKRLQLVHSYLDKKANHVLIECSKYGKDQMIFEPSLIIYQEKHQMTDQAAKLLGGHLNVT
ncbi:tRNA1(Val) (adenine(37)-N6)-methyltransferase [Mariniplasma anaerobium]|uniref:Methyltransferase n=1 Tax=Mariniplasma anaerobium TaxID=2735436 RepID=A0A7U9XVJ1_9MOLU|nr:methyltransferase [Mariniplasma anaerobium]BCR35374.1 methyltransferase [Mariniplasma anaerobium]